MEEQMRVETTAILARWQLWLRRYRRGILIAAGVILVLALAVLGIITWGPSLLDRGGPFPSQDPISVVQQFMEATAALDEERMLSYIAPQARPDEVIVEIQMALQQLRRLEYRDTRLELLDNDGQTAHVHITTTLYYELVQGGSGEAPLRFTVTLVRTEGRWYILETYY